MDEEVQEPQLSSTQMKMDDLKFENIPWFLAKEDIKASFFSIGNNRLILVFILRFL